MITVITDINTGTQYWDIHEISLFSIKFNKKFAIIESTFYLFATRYRSKKFLNYCYWRIMNVLFCANVNVCVSMHTIESERGGEDNRLHSKINTIPLINQEASKIICQP